MTENNDNIFNLSDSAINAMKKNDLAQKIINLKGKVVVDTDIHNLCNEIKKISDTIEQLSKTNDKIYSELTVVQNVDTKLEKRIIDLPLLGMK